ncbi:hypothetical protein EDL96_12835 [Kocuria soli]|uniref:Uncharacterized protein n=1 Tax=Kocuria soli TaxID=2485125 RepID=A0A3N3ZM19_9MICC|nr:hypothetical protein [Kocuria soli]ROZ61636.1 hypothetical protein EDL96_12835 [Kocuria soli]
MSEDIGNVEADLEALMAALELAGTVADRARRDALRLAQHLRKDPPRSRKEWADRAQLKDAEGRDLGWLDTSMARRVDLGEASGAKDRNIPQQSTSTGHEGPGPGELVELEGQFFKVQAGAGKATPEQVQPISVEDAQARLAEHRPDLQTRLVGEADPRLEISRRTPAGPERVGTSAESEPGPELPTAASVRSAQQDPGAETTQEQRPDAPAGGRSAAEAFGAVDQPGPRARPQGTEAAPSTAELTAIGATKPAETTLRR